MLKNSGTILFRFFLLFGLFLLTACGQIRPLLSQETTTSPTEGTITPMTLSLPTPADTNLQNLIESIKTDLASRQAASVDEIIVKETTQVEWSDSSLDCPQPGMDYPQVITLGYRVVLEAKGQSYEYHTNRDAYFVYCENNLP